MKQNLIINLIPFELSFEKIKIYYSEDLIKGYDTILKKYIDLNNDTDKEVCWSLNEFENSIPIEIEKNNRDNYQILGRLIKKSFNRYFLEQTKLIISNDFIGDITLSERIDDRISELMQFKQFKISIIHPKKQYARMWCLRIFYTRKIEITKQSLNSFQNHDIIKKALVGDIIKPLYELTENEKKDSKTKAIVSKQLCDEQGWPRNYYRPPDGNKYIDFYNNISDFYSQYLKGKDISINANDDKKISIFASGFQSISNKQIIHTKPDSSNLLMFGRNRTHFHPYYGIKEYGPYQSFGDGEYKFFFIFHEADKDTANKLYTYFTKGVRGFPGLFRFVGLNMDLDKEKTITFTKEEPISEIERQLNSLNFKSKIKYIGIYISRIQKDDPDPNKKKIYYQLKQLLLKHNITSQVIYKDKIEQPDFSFSLPNIGIAILAKLGGIPWKLSRPIKHDLIIGVGAFRQGQNTYIGTTMTFKNDGSFVQFESSQANSIKKISSLLKSIIQKISTKQIDDIERIIIHYYKMMNRKESNLIEETLSNLELKIPYVVLHITESSTFIPFDISYKGKMPVSGTSFFIKKGHYLLCNNDRYSNATGAKINNYPYPIQIKISKINQEQLSKEEIELLIDQIYQFSKICWFGVKQKEKPVTILYSEKIAKFSSFFDEKKLPNSDTAKNTLWFL